MTTQTDTPTAPRDADETRLSPEERFVLRQHWQYQGGPVITQAEWEALEETYCSAAVDTCGAAIRERLVHGGYMRYGTDAPYLLTDTGIDVAREVYAKRPSWCPA